MPTSENDDLMQRRRDEAEERIRQTDPDEAARIDKLRAEAADEIQHRAEAAEEDTQPMHASDLRDFWPHD